MSSNEVQVIFQPSGRSVYVLPGTKVLEAAGRAGIVLLTPCGGQGTCGKCRVTVLDGRQDINCPESELVSELRDQRFVPACQASIRGPATIEIPEDSRFEHRHRVLVEDTGRRPSLDPAVRKIPFQLIEPSNADDRADSVRFSDAVGEAELPVETMRRLPRFLRDNNWKGTAVIASGSVVDLAPDGAPGDTCGVAVDLGTTTVVGTLFDLSNGSELAVASRMNGQIAYGDDVISRIMKIREDPGQLEDIRRCAADTINEIVADLTESADISADDIYDITVAGNSTMQQILCGYDPSALGEVPFVQVFEDAQCLPAADLGLRAHRGARVFVFPQIGGFVGGDTVAGMLASSLDQSKAPVLLIDIGTNGEIVLAHDGDILATSTAAGPAFEGARIVQGMRAAPGAIEKVMIDDDVTLNVIADERPAGICGTALIDAAAGLLRKGILDPTGRILSGDELPDLAPALRSRLATDDGQTRFILAAADGADAPDLCLWQKDMRELQLAAGAIRAGTNILLRTAGVAPGDLSAVLLAGAFGNFIRRSSARRVGLLPDIPCHLVRFIGNAASLGAKLALLSREQRDYAAELQRKTRHVDLSLDAEFQSEFAMAMIFPETDVQPC